MSLVGRQSTVSAVSQQTYHRACDKTHKGSNEELLFSYCFPISLTIYSPGVPVIAYSGGLKRVGTFLKNCFVV